MRFASEFVGCTPFRRERVEKRGEEDIHFETHARTYAHIDENQLTNMVIHTLTDFHTTICIHGRSHKYKQT